MWYNDLRSSVVYNLISSVIYDLISNVRYNLMSGFNILIFIDSPAEVVVRKTSGFPLHIDDLF